MESEEGRRLHSLAAQARERNEIPEAISLVFKAFEAYESDQDHSGAAEVLVDGSISLRNKGELDDNQDYFFISQGFIESAIRVAELSQDKSALVVPYFNLGKILEAMGQTDKAINAYQKAFDGISNNPPNSHANRPAIIAYYKTTLLIAKVRAGEDNSLSQALNAIEDLQNAEEVSDYNKHVWVSGAYMDLARGLKEKDPNQAKIFLQKAKEIIDSDPELKIRKQQWEKLAIEFN